MLEKLDAQHKLTANQWKIAFAATIGDMLDFFDFGLIAFVLAFIVKDWHLTFGQSGMILLASGISAPFGSLLWGWAADKIGRRKAMIGTVLNTSIATGAMALTPEHAWIYLVICRLFVGFGEQKTPESFRQARRKFIYARLDEALSLAIGFGRVRPGSDVFEAEFLAGFGEMPREIARAVVGHNALDLDPQT